MDKKIIVGMSGGVDSAAAALMLKKQGYEVTGVTLDLWNGGPESENAVNDAGRVCSCLGIRHTVLPLKNEFFSSVIRPFALTYSAGRTPNPCVICNRDIKWKSLLSYADEIGADKIATGHYAHILKTDDGRYTVSSADAKEKDQTYALCRLTQDQLSRTLMPLASFRKPEIRKMLEDEGISIAHKPDSQDICFIPDGDHLKFLRNSEKTIPEISKGLLPGPFTDKTGCVLGSHEGLVRYTIGQRKGLGLAMGHPVFVVSLNAEENTVVIGENEDLFRRDVTLTDLNFMGISEKTALESASFRAEAKIRYAHRMAPCYVTVFTDGHAELLFDSPVRAVTPGQYGVVYNDDRLLFSGIIS